jgi:type IV secretory pathway TraG/TraD family ATPase VirD4
MNQLERSYGKEVARSILTGCNTKFIFNPGEPDSADFFSRMLGEEEIATKQRSRSTGKGGSSVSISEQEKGRKLFEPAQFLKLPQGKCVFISPGYGNKTEKSIPFVKEIYVPPLEIELMERLKPLWEDFIKQRIVSLGGDQVQDDRLHLNRRQFFVASLFSYIPPPPELD